MLPPARSVMSSDKSHLSGKTEPNGRNQAGKSDRMTFHVAAGTMLWRIFPAP